MICRSRRGRWRKAHTWDKDGVCIFCDKPKCAGPDQATKLRQRFYGIDRRETEVATMQAAREVRRMERGLQAAYRRGRE